MPSSADFHRRSSSARKILVVDLGFLGDTVHLIPALWELRRNYPSASLHVLTTPVGASLLELVPCVDRAWAFPLGRKSPPWHHHWKIIAALRREKFDLAVNFSGADRTLFLTALTGARWRLARQGQRRHFWQHWLIRDWIDLPENDSPMFEQRRQVLAAAGLILAPAAFNLRLPASPPTVTDAPIHISIKASTPVKAWPAAHWLEFIRLAAEAFPQKQIIASSGPDPDERAELRRFVDEVSVPQLHFAPTDTIAELAILLRQCSLHVGADSGVLHLAMALGLPTVAIFRRYPHFQEWLPPGPQHQHVAVDCPCLGAINSSCLPAGKSRCLSKIDAGQILALAKSALSTS